MDRILLVGMMGSGKSTVGKHLADQLGWEYSDSDAEVVARAGRTVAEIFSAEGETAFRTIESAVLAEVLARSGQSQVISVAGGAVLNAENRNLIRTAGTVVWLRAMVTTLLARVGDGSGRPLLSKGPTDVIDVADVLEKLDAERKPLYEDVSNIVIDVDSLAPEAVVVRILEEVGMSA